MIKLGVTKMQKIERSRSFFKRKKKISIPLLKRINDETNSSLMDHPHYNELKLGGTYKRTHRNRFEVLDCELVELIKNKYAKSTQRLLIHDMAASNGITSCEFYDKIEKANLNFDFTASDRFSHIYIVKLHNSRWITILDSDLNVVQYVGYGFVLSYPESAVDFINRLLLKLLDRYHYPLVKSQIEIANIDYNQYVSLKIENRKGGIERFPLIHPQILEKTELKGNFHFKKHDIFQKDLNAYDVIRAMNILNLDYFSNDKIIRAVKAILSSLKEDGVFIVGRSSDDFADEMHKVSVFWKKAGCFESIGDFDGGSEIKKIIVGVRQSID